MADFHHGDPYYPIEGGDGWIEEDPEEDPEELLEEDPEEDSDMEIDMDENPPTDVDEDSEHEESDPDIDNPEVVNEPYPIRDRDLPLPPPSFQEPLPPTRWETQLHTWSRVEGLRSTFDMGQSSQAPHPAPAPSTPADRALPIMVARVSRLDTQIRAISSEMTDIGGEARATSVRVRRIEEDQNLDEEAIQIIQGELAATEARVHSLEERMAAFEQRTLAAEARATAAEQRADEATREMSEMAGHLTRQFGF